MFGMGFIERDVRIGIASLELGAQNHHGSATIPGNREKLPFSVDKPKRLKRPAVETIQSVFKQLTSLGYPALAVEFRVGRHRRVYQLVNNHPVLIQVTAA